jgi:alpha-tubulin suppressor-like RCC1 family protein
MRRHVYITVTVAWFAAVGAALALGCVDWRNTQSPTGPQALISDATHSGGKPHFYFLPPLVSTPAASGTFDAALEPRVEICALSGEVCAYTIAIFFMTTDPNFPRVTLNARGEWYSVNWNTDQYALNPAVTYRISVWVRAFELGVADVAVVSTRRELKNVNTGEFVPLLNGETLPIKFRIEQGVVAAVTVTPPSASASVGGTRQYVADLTDLHDAPLSGPPVVWTSSDQAVATVEQTGRATAVGNGRTTITATSAGVSGSALLVVHEPRTFTALTIGDGHTCGVTTSGAAYCWGWNLGGKLGNGAPGPEFCDFGAPCSTIPVAVTGDLIFAGVSAGEIHTCGVTTGGAAYCWGADGAGKLGDGPPPFNTATSPVPVAGGLDFASVSAGSSHTCGVTVSGDTYCWGNNGVGQLGTGAAGPEFCLDVFPCSTVPVAVTGGLSFATVSVGSVHTCGVTTGGESYCWGGNFNGQLGDGTTTDRSSPVRVLGILHVTAVSAGAAHTCAVTTDGAAYCWGRNFTGQLGNGSTGPQCGDFGLPCSTVPVAVVGTLRFAAVSAGANHTCGVTTIGGAYCWGDNQGGQLGDGTRTGPRTSPVAVVGGLSFATLSAGGTHTFHSCGVTTAGVAYCWGYNDFGQVGDGTRTVRASPVPVL